VAIAWQPGSDAGDTAAHSVSAAAMQGCQHATAPHQVMHIANVQQQLYPSGRLLLHPDSQLGEESPGWFRYILAAYKVRLYGQPSQPETLERSPQQGTSVQPNMQRRRSMSSWMGVGMLGLSFLEF
jgi:hypothetical protein